MAHHSFYITSSLAGRRSFLACLLCLSPMALIGQSAAPSPASTAAAAPDVLVFTNGDQLTGKLLRATPGTVVFHSDMAGDLSVPVEKIKDLQSSGNFAVISKNQKVLGATVRPGPVQIKDGKVVVAAASVEAVPVGELGYIIDEPTFRRETNPHPSFFYGWNGSITGGATLVRATQTGTTLTAGINLIRIFPTVGWLAPRNRTTVDLTETYGTSRSPTIPQTTPPTPDAVVKTSIFHADAERDEYLSPRFFYLGEVSFDHNYSLGLDLQQIFGAGVGWTPIQRPKQQLDLKADVHYEKQAFFDSADNQNLIGSTFGESYFYDFPRKIVFTESGNVIPSWNNANAYSANLSAALALPVWQRFAASLSATDNFINNPSPGYRKSSFQFVTGITYTLK